VLFYGLRGLCVGRVDQFDRLAPGYEAGAFLHKNNKKKTGIIEKQFILMTRWIFL
jgi:hypothetical protein